MGMYTEIKGEIDYGSSDFPDIIERVLEMIQSVRWTSGGSRYYLRSGKDTFVEMYNGENEFFHRTGWFKVDKGNKKILLEGEINNYQDQYQRTLSIIARYLSKDSVAEGTQRYEEFEHPQRWYIKDNKLFWAGKPYKLGSLNFLRLPLPHPEEWNWEE